MKVWLRLLVVLLAATLISSVVSHVAIKWLQIKSEPGGYKRYGPPDQPALTILHGSSLAYSGIDWGRVSNLLGDSIESWATAGSSPTEWEVQHDLSPQANRAFIVVSAYDLNEYWLCDFRADIVPFGRAIRDLQYCGAAEQLCKRIVSQYPQMLVRGLYPTAGRSDGVMVGVRTSLYSLSNRAAIEDVERGPTLGLSGTSEIVEKLSEWPPARLQRRLVLMRKGFQGKHWFNGPKKMALVRLLERVERQGDAVVVVVPVSPTYRKEFLSPQIASEFDEALAQLQARDPRKPLIRLDRLPALDSDAMYYDLVHLNRFGQEIATAKLLKKLEQRVSLQ